MSLVSGEDSESDEEINTEQFGAQQTGHTGSPRVGIIAGEDDEDETDTLDGSVDDNVSLTMSTDPQTGLNMKTTASAKKWEPPTVLHKKLGEANYSLRRNIVLRLLQLYQNTCRNLTLVNDNLTKAQHVIEKVNTNIKRSDQDLVLLKSQFDDIFSTANHIAPGITIKTTSTTSNKTQVS